MRERRDDVEDYWQVLSETTAVRWTMHFGADGKAERVTGPHGLVMHDDVSVETVRGIPLSRLQPYLPGHTMLNQSEPPTADQVSKAWRYSAPARSRAARGGGLEPFTPRLPDETADEFYQRVAKAYRLAARLTGQPLKWIMEAADVPKTTAARWVREARTRGYLDPTTRGRGRG
jgi:hypothetical protein